MGKSIMQTNTDGNKPGLKVIGEASGASARADLTARSGFSRGCRQLAGVLVCLALSACAGERPTSLGVHNGQLRPCPETPNCVSTFPGEDAEHAIHPLLFSADPAQVMARVKHAVESQDRARVIQEGDHYLYAEFESLIFGFVDDVEFYFEAKTGTLHVRSASRIGKSDLGVNRERVENLFSILKQTHKK